MFKGKTIVGGILLFFLLFSCAFAQKVENLPRVMLPSGTDDNEVRNVKAIYVGPGGEIYIGSARNNRVQVFSSNGQYLRSMPSMRRDDIEVPQDIDISKDGSIIYVVDREREEVIKFDPEGVRIGKLGDKKLFDKPMSVSVSETDIVYVADKDKKRVFVFDKDGQPIGTLQGSGCREPIAVDVDHTGRIFVLDKKQRSVHVFDSEGSFLRQVPIGFGGAEIEQPVDLCVNTKGQVFVLDEKGKVFYFLSDYTTGKWSKPFGGAFEKPISIDVQGDDVCLVLDNRSGEEIIWKFRMKEIAVAPPPVDTGDGGGIIPTPDERAVIKNNIDSTAHIKVHSINREKREIVLSVFEAGGELVPGLIAPNYSEVAVGEQPLTVKAAQTFFDHANIDFLFLVGTEGLNSKEIKLIRDKIPTEFLAKLNEARHRVAVFTFAGETKLALPFENSFSKQKAAFSGLQFNGEKAPLYDAVFRAVEYYDSLDTENYPVFIVITNSDGSASRNGFSILEDYKDKKGLPQILTIGYHNRKAVKVPEKLKQISDFSGGFFYATNKADKLNVLLRRMITLIRNEYMLKVDRLPDQGELAISVDVDLDGNLFTSIHEYQAPTGGEVKARGKGFFEKYGLILIIILGALILLIIIIILIARAGAKPKGPLGEALLVVKSGDAPQKEYRLVKGPNVIGSGKECDIALQSEGISGKHAVIEYAGGKYELVDSDSTNGTFVNRNRITRRVLINDDIISIASVVEFIFKSR